MWASVQRIRVQNGADDGDVARRISEELVPALLEDAGASRCWWALDPSSRVVLGVTLWSDQTAYFEGRGSAARIRAGALDPLGAHTLVAHSVELSPAARESWGVLTGRPALHPGAWSLVLPVGCSGTGRRELAELERRNRASGCRLFTHAEADRGWVALEWPADTEPRPAGRRALRRAGAGGGGRWHRLLVDRAESLDLTALATPTPQRSVADPGPMAAAAPIS